MQAKTIVNNKNSGVSVFLPVVVQMQPPSSLGEESGSPIASEVLIVTFDSGRLCHFSGVRVIRFPGGIVPERVFLKGICLLSNIFAKDCRSVAYVISLK